MGGMAREAGAWGCRTPMCKISVTVAIEQINAMVLLAGKLEAFGRDHFQVK